MDWRYLVVDILFVVIAFVAIYRGYKRGLVGQAIWFFSAFIGLILALRLSGDAAELLDYGIVSRPITIAVCFAVIFLVSIWLLHRIGVWVTSILNKSFVGTVNSVLGAIFSGLLLLVSVAFVVGLAQLAVPGARDYLDKTVVMKQVMKLNAAIVDQDILDKLREVRDKN